MRVTTLLCLLACLARARAEEEAEEQVTAALSPPRAKKKAEVDDPLLRQWRRESLCKSRSGHTNGLLVRVPATTIRAGEVATSKFYAVNETGGRLRRGGDVFEAVYHVGPARVQPSIRDHCDGSYEISAALADPGLYQWQLRLRWTRNEGLDERLDPRFGDSVRRAKAVWLQTNWTVTVLEDDMPKQRRKNRSACEEDASTYDVPSRFVGVRRKRGGVGSLYKSMAVRHPDEIFGLADPDETWVDKWRPQLDSDDRCADTTTPTLRRSRLAGMTVAFVGDSTVRVMFANFVRLALGVRIASCLGRHSKANLHPCMCHGVMAVTVPAAGEARVDQLQCQLEPETTRLSIEDVLGSAPKRNETRLVYAFASFADCASVVKHQPELRERCEHGSGTVASMMRTLEAVLPVSDLLVANVGEHVTARGGVPACVAATRHWLPTLAGLSPLVKNGARFLVDSQPTPFSATERLGTDEKGGIGVRHGNNARTQACNGLQRRLVAESANWTWVAGRYDAALLAPEWHESGVHYVASPVVFTLRRAIADALEDRR